jgi:hypothetical protein
MRVEQKDLEYSDILVFGQTSGSIRGRCQFFCQFFHYSRRAASTSRLAKLPIYLNKAFLGISAAALINSRKILKYAPFKQPKYVPKLRYVAEYSVTMIQQSKRPYACHAASSRSLHPSSRYHAFQQPRFQPSRFHDLGPGLE